MAHSSETQVCINQCLASHRMCEETIAYCLAKGGDFVTPEHLHLLMDCAEVSQTAANLMLRESPLEAALCNLCAEVCRRCAEDCARFENDKQMQACAELCRRCAEACDRMALHANI